MENKFCPFTDDELYILTRQAIESSWEIMNNDIYTLQEKQMHETLLNALLDEQHARIEKEVRGTV